MDLIFEFSPIVFEKDEVEDHTADLKAALDAAPEDEVLKGYDIF